MLNWWFFWSGNRFTVLVLKPVLIISITWKVFEKQVSGFIVSLPNQSLSR